MRGSTGQLDKEANSMAYITKRGNSYSVRYTYEDEHGKSCDKWESFPTKEEATNRKQADRARTSGWHFSDSVLGDGGRVPRRPRFFGVT